ncbi:listerin E3 ubiquitin protein ligase 1 [Podochytrium sp. JEL0797]|nr:listerin E3 ubiquitin protein ligase 1 [Podochytrium sp. JEL0797]
MSAAFASLLPDEMEHLDSELKVLIKRLAKKDAQTKIRATDDLKTYLNKATDHDLTLFVYIWPKIFNKTGLDADRKIRENLVACHAILFSRLKKEMAPVLKQVIGTWLCLQFDNASAEAARVAMDSFQKAFPNKTPDVLAFCQSEIYNFVSDNVVYHTVESMSDSRFNTSEEMLAKYIRVVSGSLSIISNLYETITKLDALTADFDPLLDDPKFWATACSPHAPIRRAFYSLLKTLASVSPSPLANRLTPLKTSFLNECFTDKDASTHDALWDAVLTITRHFPHVWTREDVSAKKGALGPARFGKYLENGCYGSGSASWPALLAFVAHLPKEVVVEEGAAGFRTRFLDSVWKGVGSVHVTPGNAGVFVKSIQECSLFLALKYGDAVVSTDAGDTDFLKVAPVTLVRLTEALLFPFLNADARFKLAPSDLESAVSGYISKLCSTSTFSTTYSERLSKSLCDSVSDSFATAKRFDGLSALSVDDYGVFSERAAALVTNLATAADGGKSPALKQKADELLEKLILKSMERIPIADEHMNASIRMLIGLASASSNTTAVSPSVLESLTTFLNASFPTLLQTHEESIIPLISPLLRLISRTTHESASILHASLLKHIVSSHSLLGVQDYLSQSQSMALARIESADLDALVLELIRNAGEVGYGLVDALCKNVIVQSLVFSSRDGQCAVSRDTVAHISTCVVEAMESFWNNCIFAAEDPRTSACVFFMELVQAVAEKSPAAMRAWPKGVEMMASVLEVASFGFVRVGFSDVSDTAAAVWEVCGEVADKKGVELLERVMQRWREFLVDSKFPGVTADFVLIHERMSSFYADNSVALELLQAKTLFDESTWTALMDPFNLLRPTLAIIDPIYVNEPRANTERPEINIEESTAARLACTLAVLLTLPRSSDASVRSLFHLNAFYLSVFKTLLLDSRSCEGVYDLEFKDPTEQIDGMIARAVSQDEHLESWAVEGVAVVDGKNLRDGFLLDCLRMVVAERASGLAGRVFGKIAGVAVEEMSVAGRRGVVGLVKACFESDMFAVAAPLSYAARKYLDAASADVFVASLCRASSIPKTELTNRVSIRKSVAGLSILTSILFKCEDVAIESFALPLKNLVKQFRVWFTSGNHVTIEHVAPELTARVARFLVCVIEREAEFDINVAGFVVELASTMVTTATSKPVLFNALELYQCLSAADPETWTTVDKFTSTIQSSCLDLFLQECTGPHLLVVSDPQSRLQSLLASICAEMDFGLLYKRLPVDKLAAILFTNNTEAQVVAYRLLSKLTVKLVEVISVRLEMSVRTVGEDGETISKEKYVGEGLAEGLVKEIPLMEAEHLIESKLDLHTAVGVLLSWMTLLDHFIGATFDLKTNIINEVKVLDSLDKLLEFVFFVLGVGYTTKPFDLTGWDFSEIEIEGLFCDASSIFAHGRLM